VIRLPRYCADPIAIAEEFPTHDFNSYRGLIHWSFLKKEKKRIFVFDNVRGVIGGDSVCPMFACLTVCDCACQGQASNSKIYGFSIFSDRTISPKSMPKKFGDAQYTGIL